MLASAAVMLFFQSCNFDWGYLLDTTSVDTIPVTPNPNELNEENIVGKWRCDNAPWAGFDYLDGSLTVTFNQDHSVKITKSFKSTITNSITRNGTWALDARSARIVTTATYPGTIPMTTGNVWIVPTEYANQPIVFSNVSLTSNGSILIMNDAVFIRQ